MRHLCLALLLLAACDDTMTVNPSVFCPEKAYDPDPPGKNSRRVLERARGERSFVLRAVDADRPNMTVDVSVSHRPEPGDGEYCDGLVSFGVQVTLKSADGSLDWSYPGGLTGDDGGFWIGFQSGEEHSSALDDGERYSGDLRYERKTWILRLHHDGASWTSNPDGP